MLIHTQNRLDAMPDVQLAKNIAQMALHCLLANQQALGDLFIRPTGPEKTQDLLLSRGQRRLRPPAWTFSAPIGRSLFLNESSHQIPLDPQLPVVNRLNCLGEIGGGRNPR